MQYVKFPRNVSIRKSIKALMEELDDEFNEDADGDQLAAEQGLSTNVVSVESFEEMIQLSSYPNELAEEEDNILLDRFLEGKAIEEVCKL